MAIEQRGTNTYYYRKRWVAGTCQSEYVGGGPAAQLIAQIEAEERLAARQQAVAIKREQRTIKEQAALVLGTEADVRALVTATLLANGFHQHKRQWRKRMQQDLVPQEQPPAIVTSQPVEPWQRLREALRIAPVPTGKNGKVTQRDEALAAQQRSAAVKVVLRDYPELWSRARHMLSSAERTLVEKVTPGDGSPSRQFLEHALKGMRRDLGYETAPPLERLLIEQVAVAWLDWDIVQQMYVNTTVGTSHSSSSGAYWDRRATGAQARYLRAMEALARVRRLAMPQPLQVNIGGQQVNVAGATQPL